MRANVIAIACVLPFSWTKNQYWQLRVRQHRSEITIFMHFKQLQMLLKLSIAAYFMRTALMETNQTNFQMLTSCAKANVCSGNQENDQRAVAYFSFNDLVFIFFQWISPIRLIGFRHLNKTNTYDKTSNANTREQKEKLHSYKVDLPHSLTNWNASGAHCE